MNQQSGLHGLMAVGAVSFFVACGGGAAVRPDPGPATTEAEAPPPAVAVAPHQVILFANNKLSLPAPCWEALSHDRYADKAACSAAHPDDPLVTHGLLVPIACTDDAMTEWLAAGSCELKAGDRVASLDGTPVQWMEQTIHMDCGDNVLDSADITEAPVDGPISVTAVDRERWASVPAHPLPDERKRAVVGLIEQTMTTVTGGVGATPLGQDRWLVAVELEPRRAEEGVLASGLYLVDLAAQTARGLVKKEERPFGLVAPIATGDLDGNGHLELLFRAGPYVALAHQEEKDGQIVTSTTDYAAICVDCCK